MSEVQTKGGNRPLHAPRSFVPNGLVGILFKSAAAGERAGGESSQSGLRRDELSEGSGGSPRLTQQAEASRGGPAAGGRQG
eukprot:7826910-Pyramimonas_sp.AAC.1